MERPSATDATVARDVARSAGVGVLVGLLTMFVLVLYSFEAATEPERDWAPIPPGWVVGAGFLVGPIVGLVALGCARRTRHSRTPKPPRERS